MMLLGVEVEVEVEEAVRFRQRLLQGGQKPYPEA